MAAFKEVTATFYVHLPPSSLPDPTDAITQKLGTLLLTYHETLGGVVLALSKLRVASRPERVMYDSPFIHLHVTADVLLFAPAVGLPLAGRVNFVGSSHVGLLVHGVVNVSISVEKLPEQYVYDEDSEGEPVWHEESESSKHSIAMDSELQFYVTKVNVKAGAISLQGSLLPEDSAKVQTPRLSSGKKKKKKDKKERKNKKRGAGECLSGEKLTKKKKTMKSKDQRERL